MQITLIAILDSIDSFSSKNGFGFSFVLGFIDENQRRTLTIMSRDVRIFELLKNRLQQEVEVKVKLIQNSFGLRFGDVIDVN